MADEPVLFAVKGARESAVRAAVVFSTGAAKKDRGVAASVAEENDLLPRFQGDTDLVFEPL
jgi:hypothetical protein